MKRPWLHALFAFSSVDTLQASDGAPRIQDASAAPDGWTSQYGQDKFIYDRFFAASSKDDMQTRQGVFVELGAADGMHLSNTFALEHKLGWKGVLIEPSGVLFEQLRRNRPGSICVNECVARSPGTYAFSDDGYSSGFTAHRGDEVLKGMDTGGRSFRHCKSLPQILDEHLGRETHIDYLSLDLEGGEFDVLQSFDFARHVVDILSIEVHERRRDRERIAQLLQQRGYHFVERLVEDEIWVRRRGHSTDPGCWHPGFGRADDSQQRGPQGGWDRVRKTMWELLLLLQSSWLPGQESIVDVPEEFMAPLADAIRHWDSDEPALWEAECPVAVLVLGIAVSLLANRNTGKTLDALGVMHDFFKHTVFHPAVRVVALGKAFGFDYQKSVEESERNAENHQVRFELGRPWHETAFVDAIDSGWPIFGYLDLASRLLATRGHFYQRVVIHGEEFHVPNKVPRVLCEFTVSEEQKPSKVTFLNQQRKGRGPGAAVGDLLMDADVCSLLGMAASQFHAARTEVVRTADSQKMRFVGVANWTAGCFGSGQPMAPKQAQDRCRSVSVEHCAAVADGWRPVPQRCLSTSQPAPGRSLQLRKRSSLRNSTSGDWVEHGERLLREFIRRHGLYATVVATGQPEMRIPQQIEGRSRQRLSRHASSDFGGGETLFGVLQSMQELLLESEGLSIL